MGRMWNALRRGDSAAGTGEEEGKRPAPIVDAEPMLVATEEVPFIEVGPHKSMEASPSVLACAPSRALAEVPVRRIESSNAPTPPRSAPFRAVFLATPEMETEALANDPLARLMAYL